MNNPMISVVVPVYNVEQYIKICVDSILAQTFQDFEIILVDDATPDGSIELCQKLYGDNDKIKIIRHEKNLGIGEARNTGMKHSRGKYIYFVDSDDFILPDALEKFFTTAEQTQADIVHAAGWFELHQDEPEPVNEENLEIKRDNYLQEGFLLPNVIYRLEEHWKNYNTWSMAWLCFCRRDFLEKNQIEFLPIISEDETFNFALYCLTERYYIMPQALYVYRRHSKSITKNKTKNAEQLSKSIQSILLASIYIKNFLDRVPPFENYEIWRENIMRAFIKRFTENYTEYYYEDNSFSPEINAVVEDTLKKFFGESAYFVKLFFDAYHVYKHVTSLLEQRNKNLLLLTERFISEQPALLEIMNSVKSDGKKIFLMGTPLYGNLGDHAIVLGEIFILKKFFPEHKIIEVPYDYLISEFLWGLGFEKYIRREDIIFYQGGGNLGNLWSNEENIRRSIIEKFPENKIIIFPQSIHFTAGNEGLKELLISQKIYSAHRDLHLMTRDENSFDFAKDFFPEVKSYLLPDAATVLQNTFDDIDDEREGVLFILRRDKEKVRDDTKIQHLQNYLAEKNIPFETIDTVIDEKITAKNREQKVGDVLKKIRRSKLVVTDRFHGLIFSFVTNTPVLAFKSLDTKISSGIKWFKDIPSIFYAEDKDFSSMENFIDKYYSVVEEKSSDTLNLKINTDAKERFIRTLNQIFRKNFYPTFLPRRLTVDAVNISENRISFEYSVQGDWQMFFNSNAEFFIEYSENISSTPKDIAVIPFLCNVLPVAWVLDAEIVVDELDSDFYNHIGEIKQGYIDMYPRAKFGGKLTVGKLINHDYAVNNESAAFFSGGVDSFHTLITHAEEHPTLITLLGSDIKLNDDKGLEILSKNTLDTAEQFGCKNLFVTTTFRLILREDRLSAVVEPLSNKAWWNGFQHGIAIIGHAAPYVYLHKLKKIYIPSTYSKEYSDSCASAPTIDKHVHIGKCETVHDGYEFGRQDKIRRICDFRRRTGIQIQLRVCWQSSGGKNCCACEKCYRTICGILAEGENPAKMGFPSYTPALLKKMRRDFQNPDFTANIIGAFWKNIQDRFREKPKNLAKAKNLNWLMERKFL